MTVDQAIGESVHQAMWRKRIAQREIAEQIGLTQAGISKKIRGHRPFSASEIVEIARILDVDSSELLPRLDSNQEPAGARHAADLAA